MVIRKTIADTDSIHCLKPTSSNQSSVFIGYANNPDWEQMWGVGFDSSTVAKLLISKTNLAKNIVAHFLETRTWFDRSTGEKLGIDKKWLIDLLSGLNKFFDGDCAVVSAGLNRETSSNPRLYLKGLHALKRDGANEKLDLREYLFSSDEIVFEDGDGCVSFIVNPTVKIPKELVQVFSGGFVDVESSENNLLEDVDRLTIALKLFAEQRKVDAKYDDYARMTRIMFGDVDGAKLVAVNWNDFCNEHFNGSQAASHFRAYDDQAKTLLGDWLKNVREDSKDIAHELDRMPELSGLGTGGTISCMFLMKAAPKSFCSYAGQGFGSLVFLGLEAGKALPEFSIESYYHHKELQTQVLAAMAKLAIGNEDGGEADYLTINEFLWWTQENKDLIKEKVMESKYKPTEIKKVEQTEIDDFSDFIKKLEEDVSAAGLKYAQNLLKRFVCAQLAKPFVVLTGLSGSGKTKLAEAFTKWIGVENTVNIVPVGADWTNNEKLLGYPNALDPEKYVMPDTGVLKLMLDANENPDLPFFLILDEMNLSHVERYFADFLSTMESTDGIIELYDSGKRYAEDGREIPPSFKFPKNLFVIGTMNVDETTYMFSPKVLDRAQVIEFRVSKDDMAAFLSAPGNPKIDDLAGKGAVYAKAFLDLAAERKTKQPTGDELTKVKEALADVFPSLAELGAEFGYRSAIEILTFVAYYLEASGYGELAQSVDKEKCLKAAIDAGMLQKLLPKLHGSLNRLGPVLDALIGKVTKTKVQANDPEAAPEIEKLYPLTYEKLLRMKDRVEKNGFTSFAEA